MEAEATAVGRLSDTQVWGAGRCGVRPLRKRLKAACHYTVAGLCEEVSQDKEIQFSKQTIAAISEIAFRQCEYFAKDLEMFARHAKRSTVNLEDVKLLARRSKSLLKYITEKSEEIALNSLEEKEKRKKKSGSRKGRRASDEQEEHVVAESDDSNMA
ncbi:centromere protein S isoform X1 [Zootoca vivipara]|uniref:centromere protein S isoform X1 n=1 Tax=Zootoca vivipara TaxID=8524 RepID=UPI00293B9C22|nr:centromere protein S isoform X1 [Zootoca vivipara]